MKKEKLEVDLLKCKLNGITPNHVAFLFFVHFKLFDELKEMFPDDKWINKLRQDCYNKSYLLSSITTPLENTLVNTKAKELLNVSTKNIDFWEWYTLIPISVKTREGKRRVLRGDKGSKEALTHEASYLRCIRNKTQHEAAIQATEAFINESIKIDGGGFLPQASTIINQQKWITWHTVYILNKKEITETSTYTVI